MMHCYIRVKDHLDSSWQLWFDLKIVREKTRTTLLSGTVNDQAALYGVLLKIHNLGLILLSLDTSEAGKMNNDNNTDEFNIGSNSSTPS